MDDATGRTTLPRIPRPGALIASIEMDESGEKSFWLEEYSYGSDLRPGVHRDVLDICPAIEDETDDDCLVWADQVASAAGYLIMGYEKVSETSWVLSGPAHTKTRLIITGDLAGEITVTDFTRTTATDPGIVHLGKIVTDSPATGEAEILDLIARRLEPHGYHPIGYRSVNTPDGSMWELVEYRDEDSSRPIHSASNPIPYPGVRTRLGRRAMLRRTPLRRVAINTVAAAIATYMASVGDIVLTVMSLAILLAVGADLWVTLMEVRRSWQCPKCRERGLTFTAYADLGNRVGLNKAIRHHYQVMHPHPYTGRGR